VTATLAAVLAAIFAGTGLGVQVWRLRPRVTIAWPALIVLDTMQRDVVGVRFKMTNVGDGAIANYRLIPLLDGQPAWEILGQPVQFDEIRNEHGQFSGLSAGSSADGVFYVRREHAEQTDSDIDFDSRTFGVELRIGRLWRVRSTRPTSTVPFEIHLR
jgi:hypothetical protein